MNPLLKEALGSILRTLFAGAAGWFVSHGIWTQTQATSYVEALALVILALGWSFWAKYRSRIKFLTALTMTPGATESDVTAHIAAGSPVPSVSTPVGMVPVAK